MKSPLTISFLQKNTNNKKATQELCSNLSADRQAGEAYPI
jgi:hypothetical protein